MRRLPLYVVAAIAFLGVAAACQLSFLEADQPSSADASSPVPSTPVATLDDPASVPNPNGEMLQDPLYHAILQQLRKAREGSAPDESSPAAPRTTEQRMPTSAEWHAVELLLRAARILEKDAADLRQPSAGHFSPIEGKAPMQLREQALELIRSITEKR